MSIIAAKLQIFIGHCGALTRDLHYICNLIDQKRPAVMNLPQEPYMKSQYVNMLLKANNVDLETLCMSANIDMIALLNELGRAGISYDPVKRQFIT